VSFPDIAETRLYCHTLPEMNLEPWSLVASLKNSRDLLVEKAAYVQMLKS
jgi:hypothetical protein